MKENEEVAIQNLQSTVESIGRRLSDFEDRLSMLKTAETVTQQVDTWHFKNGLDDFLETPNDLTIVVDNETVTVKDKGKFDHAKVTTNSATEVKLSGGDVPKGEIRDVTLEAEGEYKILSWYWTKDGKRVGEKNSGPPS